MVELVTAASILLIAAGMATFGLQSFMRAYRTGSDTRSLSSQISLARMRAASSFTRTRVIFNTAAKTYQIELQNKTTLAWAVEGGTYFLSPGVSYGSGGVGTPAGGVEAIAIEDPPPPIIFNSRSIPVNGAGDPVNYAVYLTNNDGLTYGITVSQTGRVNMWEYVTSPTAGWQIR